MKTSIKSSTELHNNDMAFAKVKPSVKETPKKQNKYKVGDFLLEVPESHRHIKIPAMVYSVKSNDRLGLIFAASETTHDTVDIYIKDINDEFVFYNPENKFDISSVKEQLLELVDTKKILPDNQRIDEEVFNNVVKGNMPSYEEMRILLLRYHKALLNAEEKVQIYDSVIFDKPLKDNPVTEEDLTFNYTGNSFTTVLSDGSTAADTPTTYTAHLYTVARTNPAYIEWKKVMDYKDALPIEQELSLYNKFMEEMEQDEYYEPVDSEFAADI